MSDADFKRGYADGLDDGAMKERERIIAIIEQELEGTFIPELIALIKGETE